MSVPRRAEELYWSEHPDDIAELRERCRLSLRMFGGTWGAGLFPLIDSVVLVTRAGEPGRLDQAFSDRVRVILAAGTPHSRVLSIHPQEVLLPWSTEHAPMFDRAGRRQRGLQQHKPPHARRPSSTPSSAGSTSSPVPAPPARPTAVPTVEPAGPMSLLS